MGRRDGARMKMSIGQGGDKGWDKDEDECRAGWGEGMGQG